MGLVAVVAAWVLGLGSALLPPWGRLGQRVPLLAAAARDAPPPERPEAGAPPGPRPLAVGREKLLLHEEVNLLFLAGFVGATTGLLVSVFKQSVAGTESFAYNEGLRALFGAFGPALANTALGSTLVYASVPAAGGAVVGVLRALDSFDPSKNETAAAARALAAVATLGTGNSLGPEGPCVDLGTSVAASLLARQPSSEEKFDQQQERRRAAASSSSSSSTLRRVLPAAGAAAAVAAGFSAPVAGVFYALEVSLAGEEEVRLPRTAIAAVALSAAVAALIARDVMQCKLEIVYSSAMAPSGLAELPFYLGLGALAGLEVKAFEKAEVACRKFWADVSGTPEVLRPAVAGALCGAIGVACPPVLFNGYATLNTILADAHPPSATTLLGYVVLKIATTASSRAAGLVGGLFAPALFLGATAGGAYGQAVSYVDALLPAGWLHAAPPPAYASVGAASVLAALVRAPLAASMLLFELTRDYDVILPLIAATGVATVIVEVFDDTTIATPSTTTTSADGTSDDGAVMVVPHDGGSTNSATPSLGGGGCGGGGGGTSPSVQQPTIPTHNSEETTTVTR